MNGFDLHIVPGYRCNLACDHCVSFSGPSERLALSGQEIEKIVAFAKYTKINFVYFSGGEPTYHVPLIKKIMGDDVFAKIPAGITSNGWYLAKGYEFTMELLSRIPNLRDLQVSHDRFHGLLGEAEMDVLTQIAKETDLNVSVSYCIRSHRDLAGYMAFKKKHPTLKTHYQKVEPAGRAKETKSGYEYKVFEPEVLKKSCPNKGSISYICGKGFSICCSSVIFNKKAFKKVGPEVCHDEGTSHMQSDFYQAVTGSSFENLAESKGLSLSSLKLEASDSSECTLCEKIMLS
jgi:hypothetical protein